jgi:hypothetical protein
MDGSLLSRYAAARQPGAKGGRGKIFIIVGVLLVISVLVSVFSGMFKSEEKEKGEADNKKEKDKKEKGEADIGDVGYADTAPSCEKNKTIKSKAGSLGTCDSVDDIEPVGITFTGAHFNPKSPVRGSNWIHELSSSDGKKEYIAAHQSTDNYCKMVRFEIKKDGDNCKYKTIDAGYAPSSKEQGKSLCTNETNVLDIWSQKTSNKLAFGNSDAGYGIEKMKYNKFC